MHKSLTFKERYLHDKWQRIIAGILILLLIALLCLPGIWLGMLLDRAEAKKAAEEASMINTEVELTITGNGVFNSIGTPRSPQLTFFFVIGILFVLLFLSFYIKMSSRTKMPGIPTLQIFLNTLLAAAAIVSYFWATKYVEYTGDKIFLIAAGIFCLHFTVIAWNNFIVSTKWYKGANFVETPDSKVLLQGFYILQKVILWSVIFVFIKLVS